MDGDERTVAREDLGFLLSRFTSIVVLMRLVLMLSMLPNLVASNRYLENHAGWLVYPLLAFLAFVCLFLWFRADLFGRWAGRSDGPVLLAREGELVFAMVLGLGLYFAVGGGLNLVDHYLRYYAASEEVRAYAGLHRLEWVSYLLQLLIGLVLTFQAFYPRAFKGIARWFWS